MEIKRLLNWFFLLFISFQSFSQEMVNSFPLLYSSQTNSSSSKQAQFLELIPLGSFQEMENSIDALTKKQDDSIKMSGHQYSFFIPSGFGLRAKKGEYRNTMIIGNSLHYGFTNNISASIGVAPFLFNFVWNMKTKFAFDVGEFVHIGITAEVIGNYHPTYSPESWVYGYPTLSISIGTEENYWNLSYGKLIPIVEGVTIEGPFDLVTLGGSWRIKHKGRFFLEIINLFERDDYYGDENYYNLISLGGSWFNAKSRVDFGVLILPKIEGVTANEDVSGMPLLKYVRMFGKGN